jgi:hypothetical protein
VLHKSCSSGEGLALAVKSRYPEVFHKYLIACESGKMRIGNLQLVKTTDRWILNFPTKKHWRGASKLEFIEAGLKKFVKTYRRRRIASVGDAIALGQAGPGSGWPAGIRFCGMVWEENLFGMNS